LSDAQFIMHEARSAAAVQGTGQFGEELAGPELRISGARLFAVVNVRAA
jgi:hypothetical protein